jgi:choice-of-anchor B domain-containing protein
VYDLTNLRGLGASSDGQIRIFNADTVYEEFGSSHNIVGNEDTGFMYAVGSRTCTSGLHAVNVRDPKLPQFAGCFSDDGYVHDAQCVVYNGPDGDYQGREICFCYNENTLTIVDVEDKTNMRMLSRVPYNNAYYTHQGWLTEDQTHLLLDDELDELYGPTPNTRTLIWNVEDLDNPTLVNSFFSEKQATDHNLYIRGNLAYQSNYCAGLRILDVTNIKSGELEEVGYFDVAPYCDSPGFQGTWSNYPYFASGNIIVSSIERGLFVLKYTGGQK